MWQMKDESGFNRTSAERDGYYMRNVDGRRENAEVQKSASGL